jgi:hypothetical protein
MVQVHEIRVVFAGQCAKPEDDAFFARPGRLSRHPDGFQVFPTRFFSFPAPRIVIRADFLASRVVVEDSPPGIQRSRAGIQRSGEAIERSREAIQRSRAAILEKKTVRELIREGILGSPSPISPCQEIGVPGQWVGSCKT